MSDFLTELKKGICDLKDSVCNTAESINNFVGDVVDSTIDEVKDSSSKVWNGVTGKDILIKAEKLHKEITSKYNYAENSYKKGSTKLLDSLETTITSINNHKQEIYKTHFSQFTLLANRLHNLSIKGDSFLEYFDSSTYKIKNLNGVRSKNDLFCIDFNNLNIQEKFAGVLTFGWYTRDKALETLRNVQAEARRVDEDIAKMEAHIKQLKQVLSALENVKEYFDSLTHNYEKLLHRFRYGIASQMQNNLLKNIALKDGKLDFKMMPILHIQEFQALFNLSIILKTMATMGYLDKQGNVNKEDEKVIANIKHLHLVTREITVA